MVLFVLCLVLFSFLRALSPLDDFSPLVSVVLLGAYIYPFKRKGFYLPVLSFLFVDILTSFSQSYQVQLTVYASLIFPFLLASSFFQKKAMKGPSLGFYFLVALCSLLFFMLETLSIWIFSGLYAAYLENLFKIFESRIYLIPYRFLGDLFFSTLLGFLYLKSLKLKESFFIKRL